MTAASSISSIITGMEHERDRSRQSALDEITGVCWHYGITGVRTIDALEAEAAAARSKADRLDQALARARRYLLEADVMDASIDYIRTNVDHDKSPKV